MSGTDLKLVQLIEHLPCLYNPRNPGYKQTEVQDKGWETLSTALNRDVQDCKLRWIRLCVEYVKRKTNLIEVDPRDDQIRALDRTMEFMESLLLPDKAIDGTTTQPVLPQIEIHIPEKDSIPEIDLTSETTSANISIKSEPLYDTDYEEENMNVKALVVNGEVIKIRETSNSPLLTEQIIVENTPDVNRSRPPRRKRKKSQVPEVPVSGSDTNSIDAVIPSRIQVTSVTKDTDLLKSLINMVYREQHPVELFCKSVASSLKSLSPELCSEAKIKILQILAEMEKRNATTNGR